MKRVTQTLAALVAVTALSTPTWAALYYWDIDGATAGAGGATPSGTWSTGGSTWSLSATGTSATGAVTTAPADTGTFSAGTDAIGSYTVTVSGTQNIAGLTFEDGATTITGGTLNTATLTLNVNTATAQIESAITGAHLVKNGVGTLTLTGTNTYAGNTVVNAGTLNLDGTHVPSGGGNFHMRGNNIVNINGTENVLGQILAADSGAGTSTLNVNNGGSLSATAAVLIGQNQSGGVGVLHIKNGGTFAPTTTDIRLGNAGNNTLTASGTLTLDAGGIVNFLTAGTVLRVANGGATTGTVNLNGGTLTINGQVRGDAPIGGVAAGNNFFNFNGGTLRAGVGITTFLQGMDRANVRNGGAIIDTNGFNVTIAQALLHSDIGGDNALDGGLTKKGAGILTLSSASNAYTGDTDIQGGTLSINTAYLNDLADVLISSGAVFNLNFGSGIDTIGGLFLAGVQQATGTWGATGSGATHINDTYFTGTGRLLVTEAPVVIPVPAALPAGLAAFALLALRRSGRRIA